MLSKTSILLKAGCVINMLHGWLTQMCFLWQMNQREMQVKNRVCAVALTDSAHNIWLQETSKGTQDWMQQVRKPHRLKCTNTCWSQTKALRPVQESIPELTISSCKFSQRWAEVSQILLLSNFTLQNPADLHRYPWPTASLRSHGEPLFACFPSLSFFFFLISPHFFFFLGPCQWITKTVNPRWCMCMWLGIHMCMPACVYVCLWVSVWDRMHVHMCICVSFILALALSGVTSAPYAAPGLTQYAHTDEDHPRPELLESQRCKCHAHTHSHTQPHTPYLYLYYILFYIPCLLLLLLLSSLVCACVLGLCA